MLTDKQVHELFGVKPTIMYRGPSGTVLDLGDGKQFISRNFAYTFIKFLHTEGFCTIFKNLMVRNTEFEDPLEVVEGIEGECPRCQLLKKAKRAKMVMDFLASTRVSATHLSLQALLLDQVTDNMVRSMKEEGLGKLWDEFQGKRARRPTEKEEQITYGYGKLFALAQLAGDEEPVTYDEEDIAEIIEEGDNLIVLD